MENKITYETIEKANNKIKGTDIKGKNYAEVNQRVKAFRMVYPAGSIQTEMISNENGVCIFKANVYDEEMKLIATGTAYEKENSTFINKTSYIENCETSAVGRALGMCGFGIDTSIASAEELTNAINNQKEPKNTKTKKINKDENEDKLTALFNMHNVELETNSNHESILKFFKVKSDRDMTIEQINQAINMMRGVK